MGYKIWIRQPETDSKIIAGLGYVILTDYNNKPLPFVKEATIEISERGMLLHTTSYLTSDFEMHTLKPGEEIPQSGE